VNHMRKELSYRVEYEVDKKTGQVVTTVPELNHLSSFGDSFAEAEASIREAVTGYLELLHKERHALPKPAYATEGTYLHVFRPQFA